MNSIRLGSRYVEIVKSSIRNSIAVFGKLLEDPESIMLIGRIAEQIINAYKRGGKVLLFGNGGSAADAQHIAAEFVGRYLKDRKALNAIALTTNTSILTAVGNDYSFEEVFSRQVEALGEEGDVAIGISTSGRSANVLKGLQAAKVKKLITIGLTGRSGGLMKDIVDYCLCIPADETPRIQEGHILVGHILAAIVEEELFGSQGT
jgi:D-sedoheptulose 7-phosphate isomerase